MSLPWVKSPQKPAFPVVNKQKLLGRHGTFQPNVQVSEAAVQNAVLWATQVDVSSCPAPGADPWQMPEQQLALSPRQG